MANLSPKVRDIVQYAASGDWSIPEFQREFERKYEQVAMLCRSLYEDLPVGLLTVWNTTQYRQPQTRPVSGRIPLWIVDGQQRITSFCILSGSKPNWMGNHKWNEAFTKHRIFLNIKRDGEPIIGRSTRAATIKIPLDELIHKTAAQAQKYVQGKCAEHNIINSEKASDMAVNAIQILEQVIPVAEVGTDKGVEEIATLYRRLNSQGTKLRQAQIMLAYVSQYNPGWVREEFYPFLEDMNNREEWELDPAHVLQAATILVEGKARVGKASLDMWRTKIRQNWPNLKDAIEESLLHLWDRGITDQNMVPSSYTLISLFAIHAKFRESPGYDFDKVYKWFVLANLSGHYGDAPLETLSYDGNKIYEISDVDEALQELAIDWTKADLRSMVSQKFRDNSSQALLLHVLLWSTQAKDWLEGLSIPALTRAPSKLEPHWHHIVPKAWGKHNDFEDCDKTANVTRVCGKTNIRGPLKSKPPWQYVPESKITKEALVQHLIPDIYARDFVDGQILSPVQFKDFLKRRENLIVQRGASMLGI